MKNNRSTVIDLYLVYNCRPDLSRVIFQFNKVFTITLHNIGVCHFHNFGQSHRVVDSVGRLGVVHNAVHPHGEGVGLTVWKLRENPAFADIVADLVKEAAGEKCPRCWMHSVKADPETGLCPRCAAIVAKL